MERFQTLFAEGGRLPIKRTAEPSEIAGPIVFLLSERNTCISSATIVVGGGLTSAIRRSSPTDLPIGAG